MRRLTAAVLMLWIACACGTEPQPTNSEAVAVCSSGAQLLQVAQGAMDPTLQSGDVVAVVPLGLSGPTRGDIVAFDWRTWTGDALNAPMRVIGKAGDDIELRAGTVVRNGSALAEPYLETGVATNPVPDDGPSDWFVPDGSVLVLGDGRQNAADSRVYGLLPNAALLGRVVFRCGPAGRSGPVS